MTLGTEVAPEVQGGGGAHPATVPAPRRVLPWVGVAALLASAVVGSNVFGARDLLFEPAAPKPAPPAAGRVAGGPVDATVAAPTALRSQPWWQEITTLEGTGTLTAPAFTVDAGALQWRARWTCQTGRLQVRVPGRSRPIVDGACSAGAVGYSTRSGAVSLQVTADGPWRLELAQQVDAALVEPPLPAMSAPGASTIGSGSFYNIDKTGVGRVTLYRQADGRYALRLDDFFVSPTADLELRFSPLEAPRSSKEFIDAQSELIVPMDVTAGSLNYLVPANVDPTRYRSVVVWCGPINSAYAAAPLGAVR